VQPEQYTQPEYVAAFRELAARIAASLATVPPDALPIRMYVAGGAALHFHTGERVSIDVDAVFSRRIALPEGLEVTYRDPDGAARLLYLDRQYNETFALMHEDAHRDSVPLALAGIDPSVLDVRVLAPVDLAVSKLGRFSAQDRVDIASLVRRGLVTPEALQTRATQALTGYIGDARRLQAHIALAVELVAQHSAARK
jgi:hypothetical protein